MARQPAYDPVEMRRAIVMTFWEAGYAETSLSDLEAATGLNRRQLYNGLGDKRAMFLTALDEFDGIAGQLFLGPLEQETAGLPEIAHLLRTFVALSATDGGRKGCMVCSTSQEDIAADGDVRQKIDAFFNRIEAAYHNALSRAAERGESALSPEQVTAKSAQLLGVHVALCILGRADAPGGRLHHIAEEAIATLT